MQVEYRTGKISDPRLPFAFSALATRSHWRQVLRPLVGELRQAARSPWSGKMESEGDEETHLAQSDRRPGRQDDFV